MEKRGFNLLRPQLEPPSVWTKLYDWVTGTARIIVIVIELIVVILFAVRVLVDIEAKRLNDDVKIYETVVKGYDREEQRFLEIQSKTSAYQFLWTHGPLMSGQFAELKNLIPLSAKDVKMNITREGIFVSGIAKVSDVKALEAALKNSTTFIGAEVVQLETQGSSADIAGSFQIRAFIREQKFRTFDELNVTGSITPTPTLEEEQ